MNNQLEYYRRIYTFFYKLKQEFWIDIYSFNDFIYTNQYKKFVIYKVFEHNNMLYIKQCILYVYIDQIYLNHQSDQQNSLNFPE